MINLIKAELFRLYKLRSLKIIAILTWLQPILLLILAFYAAVSLNDNIEIVSQIPNGKVITEMSLILINIAMPFYIVCISAFSNSDEYISNVVSRSVEASYSRNKILVSKIITEYIISFIIIIVTIILFQLLRFIPTTSNAEIIESHLNITMQLFVYMFLGTTCSLAFLNLMFVLLKKDFYVGISYVFYFLLDFILNSLGNKVGVNLEGITKYLPGALYKSLIANINAPVGFPASFDIISIFNSLIHSIRIDTVMLLGYMVVFTTISFIIFNRKDFI